MTGDGSIALRYRAPEAGPHARRWVWSLLLLALIALLPAATPAAERPLVGAIRWDGWYGGEQGAVGRVLEECLTPERYRGRAPVFSKPGADGRLRIGPYTQAIVDREIALAKRAGIDYWAYVSYDPADHLSDALKFHLASKRSADVRFCNILEAGRSGSADEFVERTRRFVDLMRRPNYCRVAGGRPLFFVGFVDEKHLEAWGSRENGRKLWEGFRARVREAVGASPYLVLMDFDVGRAKDLADALGFDAIGCYAITGDGGNESPYSALTEAARTFWSGARSRGARLVPTAMAGWDRRPRIERPHPWEPWQKPGEGMNRYFQPPTPDELAAHVRDGADWVEAHRDVCPAQTLLVYAWNEHDEGGWIAPTLGEGTKRVEALERMWRERTENPLRGARAYEGRFIRGKGDVAYLKLLDTARRMFAPDPELPNLPMLHEPRWNGFVEGPTWGAWWIQNSYGTTFSALPLLTEPMTAFLANSQALWFDQMGDGTSVRPHARWQWVPPDGALCDAAAPGFYVAKQGDGQVDIHDWGMEFAAAGLLMQAELLLIGRDRDAIAAYLPKLERTAHFLDTRRERSNNLYLAGPAGNLLAPSYAGYRKPDGTYGMAYLTGLSVTTIAALDRLIELERLMGRRDQAASFAKRRAATRRGLDSFLESDGYFIRSLDPDGVRHGVLGAEKHGYIEASPNHDAVCFRVADDGLATRIMAKLTSVGGLRPHDFILPNYPSYDDMYEKPEGLWAYGAWVNGGHWSTCEARMIVAYFRTGLWDDARRSMKKLLTFAERFRMDNPLTEFGNNVYQPGQPVNLTYDAFGPPAAMLRGLFQYEYNADGLTLRPRIPPTILQLEQRFPIRLGRKQIWLATVGSGRITRVWVDGRRWRRHTSAEVRLPYDSIGDTVRVVIGLGGATPNPEFLHARPDPAPPLESPGPTALKEEAERIEALERSIADLKDDSYPWAAHLRLAKECAAAAGLRERLEATGESARLAPESARAANKLYADTVRHLLESLEAAIRQRQAR